MNAKQVICLSCHKNVSVVPVNYGGGLIATCPICGKLALNKNKDLMKMPCVKLDNCSKILMIMDKDLAGDWQYAECIRDVCAKCKDKVVK
ncbi:MAG: hypothetical protein WC479_10035 [Candidatus Izemoplasmatales bacterium]